MLEAELTPERITELLDDHQTSSWNGQPHCYRCNTFAPCSTQLALRRVQELEAELARWKAIHEDADWQGHDWKDRVENAAAEVRNLCVMHLRTCPAAIEKVGEQEKEIQRLREALARHHAHAILPLSCYPECEALEGGQR